MTSQATAAGYGASNYPSSMASLAAANPSVSFLKVKNNFEFVLLAQEQAMYIGYLLFYSSVGDIPLH